MTTAIARAAQKQREAIDMAIARGDVAEETARRRSLSDIERRLKRTEAWTSDTAAAFTKAIRQLDPKDGLRRLVVLQHLDIGLAQLHTALILRDHMNGGASGASELMERVDGGRVHNGQMEGMVDRRRPLRAACDAAREAVTDEKLMPVAMEVILYARSPRAACDRHGVTWGGQMPGRISAAIVEALDAAVANVGVARMTKTPRLTNPKITPFQPQSSTAPKADRLTVTLPSIKPPAAVLKLINPDPGHKLMDATEAMAAEVIPAIAADHHLRHMLLRIAHLVSEGEGYAAAAERKLVNNHIAQIVVHYFERKKVRRVSVEARHHVGPSRTTVFVSVFHGRSEATRILEIT